MNQIKGKILQKVNIDSFNTIFEQSPISTQIFALDGTSLAANKAWEDLWQIKHAELAKHKYNILKDIQLIEKKIIPYIKKGFNGEVANVPAIKYEPPKSITIKGTASYRWVRALIYPVKDQKGKIINVALQHEDITEQKDSELRLHKEQERLKLALDAGNIGVWDWDLETNDLTWTDEVYEIHGVLKKTPITLDTFRNLIHPEDRAKTKVAVEKALKNIAPYKEQFRIITPQGITKWVSTSALDSFDEKKRPIRMLGATSDISEQKRVEQDKNDFVSIATHELKTPVTSLKAYAEVLERKFKKSGDLESAGHLGKMNAQLDRLTSLIGDLLDATKIDGGKLQMHEEKFDFHELVSEIVEELQRTTEKHALIIEKKVKKMITADRERTGQVLSNLISNAIKYSPHADKIMIQSSATAKEVQMSVQDFGVGIAKAKQKRIFERFYRASGPHDKNTFPGLGLGLYISSEIIKRQGGRVWVDSTLGKGSIFHFTLPIKAKIEQQKNTLAETEMKHS